MISEYWQFYELSYDPFNSNRKPDEYFMPEKWEQQLSLLNNLCNGNSLLLLVIGMLGVGKSSFLKKFIKDTRDNRGVCHITGDASITVDVLEQLLTKHLTIDVAEAFTETFMQRLGNQIVLLQENNEKYLLVIDDAHELPEETLSLILEIVSYLPKANSPLHILLSGSIQLETKLSILNIDEETFENTHTIKLEAFSEADVERYILHRLHHAGWHKPMPLDDKTLLEIFRASKGLPAKINSFTRTTLFKQSNLGQLTIHQKYKSKGGKSPDPNRWAKISIGIAAAIVVYIAVHKESRYDNIVIHKMRSMVTLAKNSIHSSRLNALEEPAKPIAIANVEVQHQQLTRQSSYQANNHLRQQQPSHEVEMLSRQSKDNTLVQSVEDKPVSTIVRPQSPAINTSQEDSDLQQQIAQRFASAQAKPPQQAVASASVSRESVLTATGSVQTSPPTHVTDVENRAIASPTQVEPISTSPAMPVDAPKAQSAHDTNDMTMATSVKANTMAAASSKPKPKDVGVASVENKTTMQVASQSTVSMPQQSVITEQSSSNQKAIAIKTEPKAHDSSKQLAYNEHTDNGIIIVEANKGSTPSSSQLSTPTKMASASTVAAASKPGYTIQLMGGRDKNSLKAAIEAAKLSETVYYVHTRHHNDDWYIALLGRYGSYQEAKLAMQYLPVALVHSKPWVRSFESVQAQMLQNSTHTS